MFPYCLNTMIRTANPLFSPARARLGFDPVGIGALAREVLQSEKSCIVAREGLQKLKSWLRSAATAWFGPEMSIFPWREQESLRVQNRFPLFFPSESTIQASSFAR